MEDETDWPAPQVQRVSLSLTRFPLRHDAPSAWDRHSGNSNMILAGRWKTEDGGRMKGVNVGTNGIEGPATAGGGGGVGVSGRYFEWVDGWDGWNASCGLSLSLARGSWVLWRGWTRACMLFSEASWHLS
jgi:hypothetical protein